MPGISRSQFRIYIITISMLYVINCIENVEDEALPDKTTFVDPAEQLFMKLFMRRRREQLDAVKSLVAIDSYEKQHKMIAMMTDKIFTVIEKCRTELQNSDYNPANSSFPSDQDVLDALANTLENTALFGDLLLRLPDITHKVLKSKPEWGELVKWSIDFVNTTNLLDKQTTKLMHLVSQELNIVERDPDYVNPYSASYKRKEEEQLMNTNTIKRKKKKKKERKKGPQLSGSRFMGEL